MCRQLHIIVSGDDSLTCNLGMITAMFLPQFGCFKVIRNADGEVLKKTEQSRMDFWEFVQEARKLQKMMYETTDVVDPHP